MRQKKKIFAGTRYPLRFAHKLIIGILIAISVLCLANPQKYEKNYYETDEVNFPFLQEGDYLIDYELLAPATSNALLRAEAEEAVNADNETLVLAREELSAGCVRGSLSLSLERGLHDISLWVEQGDGETAGIKLCKIQSVRFLHSDNYLMSVLCVIAALVIAFLGRFVSPEKYKMALVAVCFGLLASFPMANDIFVETTDAVFHLSRLEALFQGLRAGEFPVRIGSTQMNGYGSLSATMYPQLFLYPVALLRFFKVSLLMCYKLMIAGCNIGCALLTYYAVKGICGSEKTALLASFFYSFSLYRLVDVYQRGALGEALAMTFLPLVIWGIYEILWGNYRRWHLLALGVTAVVQSHVLSMEICLFFLVAAVIAWVFQKKERHEFGSRILSGVKAAVFTVLLNASWLIPFLFFYGEGLQCFNMPNELPGTQLYFNQMFFSFAHMLGTSQGLGSLAGEMPLSVGGVLLLGTLLFVVVLTGKRERTKEEKVGVYCLVFGVAALLLTSWIFPWEALSKIRLVDTIARSLQFAWRFLGPASIFLCIVAAIGTKLFAEGKYGGKWIYGCFVLLVFLSTSYFFEMYAREGSQTNDKMMIDGYDKMDAMYMYYDGETFKAHNLDSYYWQPIMRSGTGLAAYSGLRRKGSSLWVEVTPGIISEDILIFPIYYFPGYKVSVNGQVVENYSYDTLLACDMPLEAASVEVRYTGPVSFRVGDIVSAGTLLAGLGYALFMRRKKASGKIAS